MQVLIADDHWMIRESLKQVMKRLHKSLDVHEAASFGEAMAILRDRTEIDLLLADLIMPGFDEFAGLKKLRAEFPSVPVVIISVHEDIGHVLRAVEHGVIGYIPKSSDVPEIERAFERILVGEVYFPRRLIDRAGSNPAVLKYTPEPSDLEQPGTRVDLLTSREKEVLHFLGSGNSVSKISEALRVSNHTVRIHLGNITKKLGLEDRSETIHYATTYLRDKKQNDGNA